MRARAHAGLSKYINKFTRFSGELFGLLIAVLFMQQAIKGVVLEFQARLACLALPRIPDRNVPLHDAQTWRSGSRRAVPCLRSRACASPTACFSSTHHHLFIPRRRSMPAHSRATHHKAARR